MPSKFKDKVGADNAREKSRGSSYGHIVIPRGTKMFTVNGGDRVKLEFLPYTVTDPNHLCRNDSLEIAIPNTEWYRKPYFLHRNVGAGNDSVVCLRTINKKCPICEYRAKLQKEGKATEEEIKALKPSDRNLYVVVPIGHKEFEEEPHIFDISRFCFQDMLVDETNENPEYRAFFDPEDGYTVSVRFSEEKLGKNKFAAASRIDFEERKEEIDSDWLKKVPDLDKVLTILSYKEIEAKFFELDAEEAAAQEEDDEEERPRKRSKYVDSDERPAKRKSRDEEEEEEEEDEKPARRRRTEPEPEEEDEEEDQDDEEDDEPEEKPKLKRNVKKEEEEEEEDSDDSDDEEEEEEEEEAPKKSSNKCVACQGSGEDSKGRECRTCKGSGKKKVVKEEEEEEEEKPTKSAKKSASKSKCPSGHEFGKDCDKFPKHCSDCPLWDPCFDASENK